MKRGLSSIILQVVCTVVLGLDPGHPDNIFLNSLEL